MKTMSSSVITVKIAGPAGMGIKSGGLLFSQILLNSGFNLRDYSEYPSLVRGGHNTYQVSFSPKDIFAPYFNVDLFFSLQSGHWQQHTKEFDPKSLIFSDEESSKKVTNLPLSKLVESLGNPIYKNTICLGVAVFILNLDKKLTESIISKTFSDPSTNLEAFNIGFDYAQKNFSKFIFKNLRSKIYNLKSSICDGNEAFGWGFIQGGGNFYAAYPMTPATGALHFLAGKQKEYKLTVVHPEDEIAVASIAAGAVFTGARAAVGTSGGGFALMNETVSFCGVANLGVVFYLVSRPGPATGLPTWTSQGDLLYAIHTGHGEFGKIVLAPGDQAESFEMSALSLNLAAQYHVPVIVLSDKFIGESSASLPNLSTTKFKIIKSTTPAPGTPGKEYLANSYEHDDSGFSIEDPVAVNTTIKKRLSKIKSILKSVPRPVFYGSKNAKKLIIGWGSTKGPILETIKDKKDFAFLQIRTMWPIDSNLKLLLKPFKNIIIVENNATSQLTTLLKSQFDFNPTKTILKFDGRPFFPEELAKKLKNI